MLQFHGQSAHISVSVGGETTQYRTDLEDLITHYAGIDFNPSTYWFKSSLILFLLILLAFFSPLLVQWTSSGSDDSQ